MNSINYKLTAYAIDFVSFLVQKIKNKEDIRNIILFGSIARNEASQESDVDLFIDIAREDASLEREIKRYLDAYLNSTKYKNYWGLIGIKNDIKLTIGKIDNWEELKPSIIANGIILYGKYKPELKSGRHSIFFIWEGVKPNSKRVLFNKQLFGYRQNGKFYPGLIQKYNGQRLGKGCVVAPAEHSNVFHNIFKKYRISVKIKKVVEYS